MNLTRLHIKISPQPPEFHSKIPVEEIRRRKTILFKMFSHRFLDFSLRQFWIVAFSTLHSQHDLITGHLAL